MELDSQFFKLTMEIAQNFLQAAVIIDDLAGYKESAYSVKELESPRTRLGKSAVKEKAPSDPEDLPQQTEADRVNSVADDLVNAHYLNAKNVIDSFARSGVICSVLRPQSDEVQEDLETFCSLATAADIVVIDWDLHGDDGEAALEIIRRIADSGSGYPSAQLRFSAIYTGEPDIATIAQKIGGCLKNELGVDVEEKEQGFVIISGANRIAVFAKPDTLVPPEYRDRVIDFEDLASRLTAEFARMTAGLVSNVVLNALGEIRKNTYKILGKFSYDLDAPYLTHRLLLEDPEEAENHLTMLVSEEVRGIFEEAHIGSRADIDAITAWLEVEKITGLQPEENDNHPANLTLEQLRNALSKGLEGIISKSQKDKYYKKDLTRQFRLSKPNVPFLDEKFAHLTIMRSYYKHVVPILSLGTIVKRTAEENSYWVCVQPRCDCVRIKGQRSFLFLPLHPVNEGEEFNVVLAEDNQYIRLRVESKTFGLRLIDFAPSETGVIQAQNEDSGYYFEDVNNEEYKWMGELKSAQAQRLSNKLAASLSRVGLEESEWLRLWTPKR